MKPGTIWLPADAELPVCVKRTIANEKRMLIIFWGIDGVAHYCWLPKDSTLDSPFFCEEVLSPLVHKIQPNSKQIRKLLTSIHMDNAGVHAARAPKRHWMFPDSNARRSHRIAQILHHQTFSFRLAEKPV
jgi:hypothetical protein